MTDHVAKAKDFIHIAEAGDSSQAAWIRAAQEIKLAVEQDGLSQRKVAKELGRAASWVATLLGWYEHDHDHDPFGGPRQDLAQSKSRAKKALRDPELRRRVLSELPPAEVEAVIEDANEVALDRVRARRAEHETRPTTRDLMGSDPFKPDEFWADNVVISINRKARELASLIQRGGGLLLGAMEVEQAFDYLNEAERLIAEARAAAQEMSRDKAGV